MSPGLIDGFLKIKNKYKLGRNSVDSVLAMTTGVLAPSPKSQKKEVEHTCKAGASYGDGDRRMNPWVSLVSLA